MIFLKLVFDAKTWNVTKESDLRHARTRTIPNEKSFTNGGPILRLEFETKTYQLSCNKVATFLWFVLAFAIRNGVTESGIRLWTYFLRIATISYTI